MKNKLIGLIGVVVAIALLASCTSCTSNPPAPSPVGPIVCQAEQDVASALAQLVIQNASCQAPASQIQNDILAKLGNYNFCPQLSKLKDDLRSGKVKGVIGNVICPPAVASVLAGAGSVLPPTWQCNPADSGNAINQLLVAKCESLVTF